MRTLILILLGTVMSQAFAATHSPYPCKKVKWPYAETTLSKKDLYQAMSTADRKMVYGYFLSGLTELKDPNAPATQLTRDLAHFLKSTEPVKEYRQFLELLIYTADLDTKKPRALSLAEVCGIESKIKIEPVTE